MDVLVVEDNHVTRLLMTQQLRSFGATVHEAETAAQAEACLAEVRVELVIFDCHLADGEGAELIRRFAEASQGTGQFVAMSASYRDGEADALLGAGAAAVLKKPVGSDQLSALVTGAPSAPRVGDGERQPMARLDPARLEELRQLAEGAGVDALAQVVEKFIESSKTRIERLNEALRQGDAEALKSVCHSWRGIAASLGAVPLGQLLEQCERSADTGDCHRCEAIGGEIASGFREVREALLEFVQQQRGTGNNV